MWKKEKNDDEFLELLQQLQRYENMRLLFKDKFEADFLNKRIEYLIRLELMRYYRCTEKKQTKYGHKLRHST